MKKLGAFVRRASGLLLVAILVFLFYLAFRLILPISAPPAAYPPPGETPTPTRTPTLTPTGQPYPPPGGKSEPDNKSTPTPVYTPTTTPWNISSLPALKSYNTPGPFRNMYLLYADNVKRGFFIIDLNGKQQFQWPVWPEDQNIGDLTSMLRVSPNGDQILYSVWVEGPGYGMSDLKHDSIWTMSPDGTSKHRLVAASDDWYPVDAIWSPDGKQIAFRVASIDKERLMPASRELWVMNADGSQPLRILNDEQLLKLGIEAPAFLFRWMGNGYIYFAGESLYAVNPQNGSLYRLMDGVEALDLSLSLAPDGLHACGFSEIPTVNLEMAGFQTVELPSNDGFVWSPDASQLAYIAAGGGGTILRNVNSGEERQLLPYAPGENIRLLAFSPDNRYLAYQLATGIYIIDLETEGFKPTLVIADTHEPESGHRALDFLAWIPVR